MDGSTHPYLPDSKLICVAVAQSLLGLTSERHGLHYARKHLAGLFPYLPRQSGCNKRLHGALGLVKRVIRMPARDSDFRLDDSWIVDSSPVPHSGGHADPVGPGQSEDRRTSRSTTPSKDSRSTTPSRTAGCRSLIAYDH